MTYRIYVSLPHQNIGRGEREVKDEMGAYLVKSGHATLLEVIDTDVNGAGTSDLPAYTSLTKDEWLALADERGLAIDASESDSKQTVYDAIVEALA